MRTDIIHGLMFLRCSFSSENMSVTFYLGNGTVSGQKILAGIELWNTDSMCSVCVEGA